MNWYVVYTKPRQEARAHQNLANQGFETFLPMIALEKLRQGSISRVIEPLFSRYIFVHLNAQTSPWGSIRSTLGVSKLLALGGLPAAVPPGLIEGLKQTQPFLTHHTANEDSYQRLLQAGNDVLFTQGPLKGMRGIFQQHDGDARAMILIEIMSRPQLLSVELSTVIPVSA
jgi:transcriptional antiterminator RfaH